MSTNLAFKNIYVGLELTIWLMPLPTPPGIFQMLFSTFQSDYTHLHEKLGLRATYNNEICNYPPTFSSFFYIALLVLGLCFTSSRNFSHTTLLLPYRRWRFVCTICRSWPCNFRTLPSHEAMFPLTVDIWAVLRLSRPMGRIAARAVFVPMCVCCLCTTALRWQLRAIRT
jgi:hypothetical protein